jgi:hypothetical protein
MKLWIFYFRQPVGNALECRMYFGTAADIVEVAQELHKCYDRDFLYYEEFSIESKESKTW